MENQITNRDTKTYLKYGSLSLRMLKSSRSFQLQRALFLFRLGAVAVNLLIDYLSYLRTGVRVRELQQVPHNPIEVWFRLSSALIAQEFGHWVQDFKAATQSDAKVLSGQTEVHRNFMQRRDYCAGELLSSAALHVCTDCEAGEQPLSLFDASYMPFKRGSSLFVWEDWDWFSHVRDGRLNKNDLFLNAARSGIGLPFSCPHFGTLDKNPNSKTVADTGYAPHAFYLERIVEGLPVEFGEEVSQLDTFKLEWFAIRLSLGARAECHHQQFPRMRIPETFDEVFKTTDPVLENLRDQLGFTNEDDSLGPRDSIHISRLCSFPVSDHYLTLRSDTNRLFMKVGELIGVWMSLTA
ncbi:hypothetical protein FGB62_209g016 [Gracilaria domingensis]|nr:hypothetical protein FGB62_209g016 [Gracilaria domingensis]